MAGQISVAIIGCGGVSQMHLDGYARHPERLRVAAVCDREFERARSAAEKYGIPAAFDSVEKMTEGAEWDIGVVCTPTPVRAEVVSTLAAAGKHLFVEKPLSDSLDEARRLVELCDAAGVSLAVDQNFRYHYPFELARSIIRAGRIGRVSVVAHNDLFFRQDSGWRTERERHALSVMGIHWLDGFRRLMAVNPQSISCRNHRSPLVNCSGETDSWIQITFEGGAIAGYVQSFSSRFARTDTVVSGEEGTLALGYAGMALYTDKGGREPVERWENSYAGSNKPESAFAGLDALACALEAGDEPPNSGSDNLRTVALLDAAYVSAKELRPVYFADGFPV
ncbi:MAG: Gfo/Idh/MocA family oxidoreductase [Chloroflexi bacterium]|nr:Gfo/Idh/MocA family oxidoreductase [Chloroflexota bacterium]